MCKTYELSLSCIRKSKSQIVDNAAYYISFFFNACATSTEDSTVAADKFARSLRVILPAVEKCRSDSADEAGMTRIFFAILANSGNFFAFKPHQSYRIEHVVAIL